MKFKLGLVINPVAGIGGAVGLKGSDGSQVQQLAWQRGATKQAGNRTLKALEALAAQKDRVCIYAAPGEMGAALSQQLGFETVVVGSIGEITSAADTERIAAQLAALPVGALLFAGGDGTARNIYNAIQLRLPVIGVPAGVKIHSAVYATTPANAGKALLALVEQRASCHQAEVMDLDEEGYREGRVQARLYGYLQVPALRSVMQNPKAASHNGENDVAGICAEVGERIAQGDPDTCYIFGAGSTVQAVEQSLGVEGTLLGIDVWRNGKLLAQDVGEKELLALTKDQDCRLILTAIGGQGHIFGRGNQQLSPQVIRQIGLDHIWIVATASKICQLPDQCLLVDTADDRLNQALKGYRKVIVGWQETLVCEVRA